MNPIRSARPVVTWLVRLSVLALAAVAGAWGLAQLGGARSAASVVSTAPRIEAVREIAKLAVLRVQVADVIEGRNAGARALVLVHGDADLVIDWDQIRFGRVDGVRRTLELEVPPPHVERARVDHDRTRIYEVVKTGLAAWNPLADPRPALLEDCMRAAQGAVEQAASADAFATQARAQAESLLAAYHRQLGWAVEIRWQAAATPKPGTPPNAGSGQNV